MAFKERLIAFPIEQISFSGQHMNCGIELSSNSLRTKVVFVLAQGINFSVTDFALTCRQFSQLVNHAMPKT